MDLDKLFEKLNNPKPCQEFPRLFMFGNLLECLLVTIFMPEILLQQKDINQSNQENRWKH